MHTGPWKQHIQCHHQQWAPSPIFSPDFPLFFCYFSFGKAHISLFGNAHWTLKTSPNIITNHPYFFSDFSPILLLFLCLLREGAIYWGRRPFVEGGGHLLRSKAVCWGREGASRWGRQPFVERGDHSPFVDRRMPFIDGRGLFVEEGRRLFIKGGRSPSVKGGTLQCGGNEFPCWETQNSTWSHNVGVSTDLDKLLLTTWNCSLVCCCSFT